MRLSTARVRAPRRSALFEQDRDAAADAAGGVVAGWRGSRRLVAWSLMPATGVGPGSGTRRGLSGSAGRETAAGTGRGDVQA